MPVEIRANSFQHEVISSLRPAGLMGVGTGIVGFCVGGAVGILRSAYPGIAAAYTGAQFFVLGSSASFTRDLLLASAGPRRLRRDEVVASTAAGALSGAAAGRFWSRFAAIPGAGVFAVIGFFGQRAIHRSEDAPQTERDTRTLMQRIADSRWSPIKTLSNEDYEQVLLSKIVKIDAEIALVDDKLQGLRSATKSPNTGNAD